MLRIVNRLTERGQRNFGLALLVVAALTTPAQALLGECGQPRTGGPVASDALEILNTAVGTGECGGFDPCICDVNSAGGVTASDALLVLRRAVGEDIPLVCPCVVTTTTTTLPGPVLTTEILLLVKRVGSYATADLAGTWDIHALTAGVDNSWSRGTLSVQSDGKFTGALHESDGLDDDISGRLAITSAGAVSCPSGCGGDFGGALDAGKTVMAVTMTPEDGRATLFVITKRAASYAQANLNGEWQANGLLSGPSEPFWDRGLLVIAAGGATTGTLRGSDGSQRSYSPTLALAGNGVITCSGVCDPNVHGSLDAGKSVVAMTSSVPDGSTHLAVATARGGSYSAGDLAGTWALQTLASGDDTPWWSRAVLNVAADGGFSGTLRGSDGSSTPIGGTLAISADGIVTMEESPSFQCGADEGKTVIACTETW